MRLPRNRLEEWRKRLAGDFGKPASSVKVVRQGGSEYLLLKVSLQEIERYLSNRYPMVSNANLLRLRGRRPKVLASEESVVNEPFPEPQVEEEEEPDEGEEDPKAPSWYFTHRAA